MDYSVFDTLLDAVLILDENKAVVYANEAAAALCDSSVKRMSRGKQIDTYITFDNKNLYISPDGIIGKNEQVPVIEVGFNTPSGKQGIVQVRISPFSDSGESRWVAILRDTTLEEVLHGKYRGELEQKEDVILRLKEAQQDLEDYSKNLEKMVAERTAQVQSANRMLSAIMDSLGQGFLVFDREGNCSDVYTKACEVILEDIPEGKPIWDVLKISRTDIDQFKSWMKVIFDEALPFDSLVELAPKDFPHSQGRHVTMDYYPIRDDDKVISNIVLVATDRTAEHEANLALDKEKAYAKMILNVVTNRKQFSQFLEGVNKTVEGIQSLQAKKELSQQEWGEIFRVLHTLEGEAGLFSVSPLRSAARLSQEVIEPVRKGEGEFSETKKAEFFGSIEDLASVYRRHLEDNKKLYQALKISGDKYLEIRFQDFENCLSGLGSLGAQDSIIKYIRSEMQLGSLSSAMSHFNDVVQLVAGKQGKEVNEVRFEGEEIRVHLSDYENLISTLVHAFRNSVDHGLESPEEREFAGKPGAGSIVVTTTKSVEAGKEMFLVAIKDDGKGIDPLMFRKKLEESGVDIDLKSYSDEQVIQHIFDAGLTSRHEIGEFSGRGIGMDAIKTEVERLGGSVRVESAVGVGTTLYLTVPLLKGESTSGLVAA